MPERTGANPYARPVTRAGSAPNPTNEFVFSGPGRFSVPGVPESTDRTYTDGFSPTLATTGSPTGAMLPDDIRIGTREPPPNSPQDTRVYRRRWNELFKRTSEEAGTATGWKVKQEKIPAPRVPEWTDEKAPIRPTASMSPMGYRFTRPWHVPRNIADAVGTDAVRHLSMADHRRTTEIFGMKPQGSLGVNTYRADVRPWDEDRFVPPTPPNTPSASLFSSGAARAFRLV